MTVPLSLLQDVEVRKGNTPFGGVVDLIAKVVHVGFDDPPALAKVAKTQEEALDCYRRVRDEIRAYVETFPQSLTRTDTRNT